MNVIRDLADQNYRDFEIIYAQEKGIVNAMNSALKKAKGDILVHIDDDVSIPPNWLTELIKPFKDPLVCGVTGPTFIPIILRRNRDSIKTVEHPSAFLRWMFDGRPYAPAKIYKCGSVSYGSNFLDRMEQREHYDIDHLEGTNWAMRTNLIKLVGGFDPKFDGVCEWYDDDVLYKVLKAFPSMKIKYNVNAFLWHMVGRSEHYEERFDGLGRIKNWLRFHWRHSRFHYKKVIWLCIMMSYFMFQLLSRPLGKVKHSKG